MDRCEPQDSIFLKFTQGCGLKELESWEIVVAAFPAIMITECVTNYDKFPRVSPPLSPISLFPRSVTIPTTSVWRGPRSRHSYGGC